MLRCTLTCMDSSHNNPSDTQPHPPAVDDSVAVHRHEPDEREMVIVEHDVVIGVASVPDENLDDDPIERDDESEDHVSGHVIDNKHSFHKVDEHDPEVLDEIRHSREQDD